MTNSNIVPIVIIICLSVIILAVYQSLMQEGKDKLETKKRIYRRVSKTSKPRIYQGMISLISASEDLGYKSNTYLLHQLKAKKNRGIERIKYRGRIYVNPIDIANLLNSQKFLRNSRNKKVVVFDTKLNQFIKINM